MPRAAAQLEGIRLQATKVDTDLVGLAAIEAGAATHSTGTALQK
jgi:hypothetical protein